MPSARGIRAGAAFVELFVNDSKLVRGLRRAQKKLKAFGDSIRDFGLKLAGAVSAITAPLAILSIKAASDAQESLSRFEAVFKDQAKAAGQFADAVAQSVGRSKIEMRDALATFQSFFVGLGFGGDQSRNLSQTLQSLALDFASFHNLSDDEAIGRFISALSGSSEVLDRFGINIKQAALQQELLAMGVRKSWSEVGEQEKALARLNIITRALGDQGAIGDAIKTAGSFTNQMKKLRGLVRDTSVAIGQALLPMVTPLVKRVTEIVRQLGEWIGRNQQLVATLFKIAAAVIAGGLALVVLGTALSSMGAILGTVASVIAGVGTAMGVLGSIITTMISPIGLTIAATLALGASLIYASGVGGQALQWLGDRFGDLATFASESFQGISYALAAGDIALAAKVLWLSLQVAWQKGILALTSLWEQFKAASLMAAYGLWHGVESAWEIGVSSVTKAMLNLYYAAMKIWTQLSTAVANVWDSTINWVAKRIVDLWGLMDNTLDTDAIKQGLDQDTQRRTDERNKQKDQELAGIDTRQQAALDMAKQQHERNMAAIGQASLDAQNRLESAAEQKINAAQADLDAARKQWQDAIAEARGEGKGKDDPTSVPEATRPPDLSDYLKGLGNTLSEARVSVSGTFNAAALQGLVSGNAADRTAKATEETAKHTKRLIQVVNDAGLAFI